MTHLNDAKAKEPGIVEQIKNTLRPYSVQILGAKLTSNIFGKKTESIVLPKIPKISSNAKSVEEYKSKDSMKLKYTQEEIQQYNYNFVQDVFLATKGIAANDDDSSKWMNTLNQGASFEGIYRAMVLDDGYYGLESMENPLSDSTIQFTIKFLEKFVGSHIKKETLEKTNFYTLKRVTTEKALDVVDELIKKEDQFLNWYSVLSSEFATDYPFAWKKKVRLMKDRSKHKAWAMSVNEQILKAEVIIKIHKTFNYLNGQ